MTILDQMNAALQRHDWRTAVKLEQALVLPDDEFPCTFPEWLEKAWAKWERFHR